MFKGGVKYTRVFEKVRCIAITLYTAYSLNELIFTL